MKIAVFHNFMDNIGGSEVVALTFARELTADLYTTNISETNIKKMGFSDVIPRIISIGTVPKSAPLRQQAALWKFRRLHLKKPYDFYIIAGDWAISAAVNHKPNLWYVHSPREIWDFYEHNRKHMVPTLLRPVFDLWVFYNRHLNKKYANEVGVIVCNSENTKERSKEFLEKDAIVVPPPIETSALKFGKFGDYWLSVNRLINHKRVDIQLRAFAKLPGEKLIVVGSYEKSRHFLRYADYCKRIKTSNVEIRSWVPSDELRDLYANGKGFIATSKEEAFGMNAVEAMAAGKPVIAPNESGYRETVIDGTTGILIDTIDEDKIVKAVFDLSKRIHEEGQQLSLACQTQAKKFDTKVCMAKIQSLISQQISKK